MTEFNPPIHTRDDEQLIAIANDNLDNWQQEAIDQAKSELTKRGITREKQDEVLSEWAEIDRIVNDERQRQREQNVLEGYSIETMIYIFLTAPLILVGKWHIGKSLSDLKQENYLRKYRQRLYLLIGGFLFLTILLLLGAN